MLKFALKNMAIKKVKILFIVISIVITSCVGLLAYNISSQVEDGIVDASIYYDMIIGPSGSSTQLAMNTIFFTDKPLGTISYSVVTDLKNNPDVNVAIPITMGDSYNGAKIIGTESILLSDKTVAAGDIFTEEFEAVIGWDVAKANNLKVGDKIITSHGLSEGGSSHATKPLTVVGILSKTSSAYDDVVFTSCSTVWHIHTHGEAGMHEEEHENEHNEENHEVCAVLVKTKSFNAYTSISTYYSKDSSLLVINPSTVLREIINNVDTTKQIVYILCAVVLLMNIINVTVITILNMYDAKEEIQLMRLIGISMTKINGLYFIQNSIIGLLSAIFSFILSRIFLLCVGGFVSTMGITLSAGKVYPLELVILAVMFIISILPSTICIKARSKKGEINHEK